MYALTLAFVIFVYWMPIESLCEMESVDAIPSAIPSSDFGRLARLSFGETQVVPNEGADSVGSMDWNAAISTFYRGGWEAAFDTGDRIGIKVVTEQGPHAGTRLMVVRGLIVALLNSGISPDRIVVWDRSLRDLERARYGLLREEFGVRVEGAIERGYDPDVFYESPLIGSLIWSDLEFGEKGEGVGRRSYVTRILTEEVTKVIQVTPLTYRQDSGVSGQLWSLARGAVDNFRRFERQPSALAQAIPEIFAMREVGDLMVLGVVDATVGQYAGESSGRLHYSVVRNALYVGRDPVALDRYSTGRIRKWREERGMPINDTVEAIYRNAGLLRLGEYQRDKIQILDVP